MHALITLVENISLFAVFAIYVYLAVVVIFIIMENRDISSTLAWILVFLLFPITGFFVYIFFGRNWKVHNPRKKQHIRKIQAKYNNVLAHMREKQKKYIAQKSQNTLPNAYAQMLRIAANSTDSLLTFKNTITVFQTGEEKFTQLKKDIRNAQRYIHLEYFIWRDDCLTREIAELLMQKARSGVEVRVLYDPIGSFFTQLFHNNVFVKMQKAGVTVVPFYNKLSPLKITTINYILHRKIVVIDGHIGYTGGMNMGQEYIDGGKRFASWRDTHVRVKGEAALALQATFAVNWEEATNKSIFDHTYFPTETVGKDCDDLLLQFVVSDPHAYDQTIRQQLIAMAFAARKNVYIQTPYFIPDKSLFDVLKLVSLAGVNVEIMMTGVPDKRIVYWAAFTYFKELLDSGVKIYHYQNGFLHAKTFSIDGEICSIGTTNMDMRSLHLSYENNVVVYDQAVATQLERDFCADKKQCTPFTMADYEKMPVLIKLRNSLVRLLSPLL